jgi:hypothetical protein
MNDSSARILARSLLDRIELPSDIRDVLTKAPNVTVPVDRAHLSTLALGGDDKQRHEVVYTLKNGLRVHEADVVRVRNGVAVNYTEPYMRRRDPDSLVIGDDRPTDQQRFSERFEQPFDGPRQEILDWLATQDLIAMPFWAGGPDLRLPALLVCPENAGFFVAAVADLQTPIFGSELHESFDAAKAVLLVAPPFRHTHCAGRQVVVHNRTESVHEIFSLNLYPGPSAKKGVYGVLLNIGEQDEWLTAHGSTVRVVTPYDNTLTILHEGASGGGKSEMIEYAHREPDGRLKLGKNIVTGEVRYIAIPQGCGLQPVTDDMALCHPALQNGTNKLVVRDAEAGWFVRVNHIATYGTDHELERLTVCPPRPLVFLNIHGVPNATCLIWEHTEDSPGRACPNPRVILPREMVPGVVTEPVEIDVRSFGVRCPPCSAEAPSYGIIGLFHVLPAPLAWLWRLVAPRGHDNPSIVTREGLQSEGVGSFWPFATGKRITLANLLLRQILKSPGTRHVLIPNQNVGAWHMGFMPQWLTREFLARRGGVKFRPDQLSEARSPLLGYCPRSIQIEGIPIPQWFIQVNTQPEVGPDAYDAGARILHAFFKKELVPMLASDELDPLGRRIIEWCIEGGSTAELEAIA